ncbi:hypothetical protein [Burkholderia gladioli]|uniref:hypothetical protein n=1 Tax=Burkholderia gladioli TaxID=28095 RepID=UPI00164102BF|nr:hypothetical protein [Burkholderia gladioli]
MKGSVDGWGWPHHANGRRRDPAAWPGNIFGGALKTRWRHRPEAAIRNIPDAAIFVAATKLFPSMRGVSRSPGYR